MPTCYLRPRFATDEIRREAGWALGRCAETQALLASALEQHESSISRQVHGVPWGAIQRAAEFVVKLSRTEGTSPGPVISYLAELARKEYAKLEDEALRSILETRLDEETIAQANEDLAEWRLIRALRGGDTLELRRAIPVYVEKARIELHAQTDAVLMAKALEEILR